MTQAPHQRPSGSIAHLPITLFSSVMGIGGTSLAWRRAAHVWSEPERPATVLYWLAHATVTLIAVLYVMKIARYPSAVR